MIEKFPRSWVVFLYSSANQRRPSCQVFSFVFGDGDPNAGRDEYRWKEIGRFIAQKGGVVTAEELAPFLDPPPADARGEGSEDESYVLPALQRFDGTPEVDDQVGRRNVSGFVFLTGLHSDFRVLVVGYP